MSKLILSTKSEERPLPKQGLAQAILIGIVDNGTVDTGEFGLKRKLELIFELPNIMHTYDEKEGPVRMRVVARANMSLHPKSGLYKAASALYGSKLPDELNIVDLLGKNCMIDIKHSDPVGSEGRVFANIASFASLMDGLVAKEPTQTFQFFFDDFDINDWLNLPDWKREFLLERPEAESVRDKIAAGLQEASKPTEAASAPQTPPAEGEDLPF